MKMMHLSDLHLGKKLNNYLLLEDQEYILDKIIGIADEQKPDCVLIAGDVYDRSLPPEEAVKLFDKFLTQLAERKLPVLIISGNHDSAERIAYGGRIMEKSGIYLSHVYDGDIKPVILNDEFGEVYFYLLPFVRRAEVRRAFEDKDVVIESTEDAVRTAVEALHIDTNKRNVLLAHQFVTGASTCESEEIYVGTAEKVSADVFSQFDYTALGHLHMPQNVGNDPRIRYCGTPLKYSFSEVNHKKSVSVVTLGEKGSLPVIEKVPLIPKIDMKELRGSYEELMQNSSDCYVSIVLTDDTPVTDANAWLRNKYKNIMQLRYDNKSTNTRTDYDKLQSADKKPSEFLSDFYREFNGIEMPEEQRVYMEELIKEIWGAEA